MGLLQALTFPELRRAIAASCDRVMPDLQALMGAARLSRSTAALSALVRALPRVISCASFVGNYLLGPLVQDLQSMSAAASPARPLSAGRAHSLLAVTVAVALHPLGKETLRENGLSIVLNDLLHKMVAAWGREGASDADKAAYRVLCRLTLDGLRFLCDYKVSPGVHLPACAATVALSRIPIGICATLHNCSAGSTPLTGAAERGCCLVCKLTVRTGHDGAIQATGAAPAVRHAAKEAPRTGRLRSPRVPAIP